MRKRSILSQLKENKRDRHDQDRFDDKYKRHDHYDQDRGHFDRENYYDIQRRDDKDDYDRRWRYDAYDDDYGSKFNPKVEVFKFKGKFYVNNFLDWLNSVERIF